MGKIKTVNSISGGKSSGYMAKHYPADYDVFSLVCINRKEAAPKDPHVIKYVNHKLEYFIPQFGEFIATAENNRTITAMMDLEQYIGREITWVRGMSFDDVIDTGTHARLPSWARRYCTEKMKLLPIFLWWFNNIGEKCRMRIGFRADEFDRMMRFFNNSEPTKFSIPIACSTKGQRRQRFMEFVWRFCEMPLVRDGIVEEVVKNHWLQHGWVGGNLFEQAHQIDWPEISNCVGCFHKPEDILAASAELTPEQFIWFIEQEWKDMGTWLDSLVTYQHIFDNRHTIGPDRIFEVKHLKSTCDTSGCTD